MDGWYTWQVLGLCLVLVTFLVGQGDIPCPVISSLRDGEPLSHGGMPRAPVAAWRDGSALCVGQRGQPGINGQRNESILSGNTAGTW